MKSIPEALGLTAHETLSIAEACARYPRALETGRVVLEGYDDAPVEYVVTAHGPLVIGSTHVVILDEECGDVRVKARPVDEAEGAEGGTAESVDEGLPTPEMEREYKRLVKMDLTALQGILRRLGYDGPKVKDKDHAIDEIMGIRYPERDESVDEAETSPWRHVELTFPNTPGKSEVVGFAADQEHGKRRVVFRHSDSNAYRRAVLQLKRAGLSNQERGQRLFDAMAKLAKNESEENMDTDDMIDRNATLEVLDDSVVLRTPEIDLIETPFTPGNRASERAAVLSVMEEAERRGYAEDDEFDLDEEAGIDALVEFETDVIDDVRGLLGDHLRGDQSDVMQRDVQLFDEAVEAGDYESAFARAQVIASSLGDDVLEAIRRMSRSVVRARTRNARRQTGDERQAARKAKRMRRTGSFKAKAKRYARKYKMRRKQLSRQNSSVEHDHSDGIDEGLDPRATYTVLAMKGDVASGWEDVVGRDVPKAKARLLKKYPGARIDVEDAAGKVVRESIDEAKRATASEARAKKAQGFRFATWSDDTDVTYHKTRDEAQDAEVDGQSKKKRRAWTDIDELIDALGESVDEERFVPVNNQGVLFVYSPSRKEAVYYQTQSVANEWAAALAKDHGGKLTKVQGFPAVLFSSFVEARGAFKELDEIRAHFAIKPPPKLKNAGALESVNEDEKARARKMQAKGYEYIIIFPGGDPEPLYAKTLAMATEVIKDHGSPKGVRGMPIKKYLGESVEEGADTTYRRAMKGKAATDDTLKKAAKGLFKKGCKPRINFSEMREALWTELETDVPNSDLMRVLIDMVREGELDFVPDQGYALVD